MPFQSLKYKENELLFVNIPKLYFYYMKSKVEVAIKKYAGELISTLLDVTNMVFPILLSKKATKELQLHQKRNYQVLNMINQF